MAELSDCQRNVGIPGHGQRICSQYIVYSDTEEVKFSTKVVKFSQNDFDLFVGSMKVEEILKIAMIPDLKFDMNPEDFSQYTYEQITNLPSIPSRWQRPLNLRRERDIRNYFFTPGLAGRNVKSVIPGAIILGERRDATLNSVTRVKKLMGGTEVLDIETEYQLQDSCLCGWSPSGADAGKYFDRCGNHEAGANPGDPDLICSHNKHTESILPYQIIDGQHRVLGIKRFDKDAEVPVVFMLSGKAEDGDYIAVNGMDDGVQAEVFEKVNNEAKSLESLHKFWIKRLLAPTTLSGNEKDAFDLMAFLSKASPWDPTTEVPWKNMVSMAPGNRQQTHIDTIRSSDESASGNSGVVSQIMEKLDNYKSDATVGNPSHKEQLTNFLRGAYVSNNLGVRAVVRDYFRGGGARPFRTGRVFEKILLRYDDVAKWAKEKSSSLDHQAFLEAWDLHKVSFDPAYATNWDQLRRSGEAAPAFFEHIWRLMWPDPDLAAGVTDPPIGPNWVTTVTNWGEYCNNSPDPISLLSPGTQEEGVVGPRWDDNGGRINSVPNGAFDIQWEGPRNVLREPVIQYQVQMAAGAFGEWLMINDIKINKPDPINYIHTLSLDLTSLGLSSGDQIRMKIIDENPVGGARETTFSYDIL